MHVDSRPIDNLAEPGMKVEDPFELRRLSDQVSRLVNYSKGFPGSQPVSFARKHIETLRNEDWYVCEKSDGFRYLLYMTYDDGEHERGEERHYLIDRRNNYWELWQRNLHVPTEIDLADYHKDTILDGELVMDVEPDGRKQPRFLVFDCLVVDGDSKMNRPLDKRLAYLQTKIMSPYKKCFAQYPQEQKQQAFLLDMKNMQFSYGIEMMFREILPKLRHGNDGLIFTKLHSPYKPGTDTNILKWKPFNENTIDFRMQLEFPVVRAGDEYSAQGAPADFTDYESVPKAKLRVWAGGNHADNHVPFQPGPPYSGDLYISEEEWESLKALGDPLNGRIVECALDDENRWRLHRFRDDKKQGNHSSVVTSVLDSIRDGVSANELHAAAPSIKEQWKKRNAERRER